MVDRARPFACRGFTLIEVLVVLVVLAVLTGIVVPNYLDRVAVAREVTLKHNLAGLRSAIDLFYRDKGRYPRSLGELAEARYIREVPEDPITRRKDSWVQIAPAKPTGAAVGNEIFDVRSGAEGPSSDGTAYATW